MHHAQSRAIAAGVGRPAASIGVPRSQETRSEQLGSIIELPAAADAGGSCQDGGGATRISRKKKNFRGAAEGKQEPPPSVLAPCRCDNMAEHRGLVGLDGLYVVWPRSSTATIQNRPLELDPG